MKSGLIEEGKNIHQLICKKAPPKISIGNTFKKVETDLSLYEGAYKVVWNGDEFTLQVERA